MSNVTVKNPLVIVSSGNNGNKGVLNATNNGTYYSVADGYYGYSQVNVNVTPNLGYKYITSSGTYYPNNDGYDGYNEVYVDIQSSSPSYSTRSISDRITSNGYYDYSPTSYGGDVLFDYIGITVSVNDTTRLINGAYYLPAYEVSKDTINTKSILYSIPSDTTSLGIGPSYIGDGCRRILPYVGKNRENGTYGYYGYLSLNSLSINYHGIAPYINIEPYAFADITSLTTLYVSDGELPAYCFKGCTNLQEANLISSHSYFTNGVSSIGSYCFDGCENLSDVRLVTTNIGQYAFNNCYNLTYITYDGSMSSWLSGIASHTGWNNGSSIEYISCTNGDFDLYGNPYEPYEEPDPEEDPDEEPEE